LITDFTSERDQENAAGAGRKRCVLPWVDSRFLTIRFNLREHINKISTLQKTAVCSRQC